MTDNQLNGLAHGILLYLKQNVDTPMDAIAILGMTLCMIYDGQGGSDQVSFEEFAESFKLSVIETHTDVKAPEGTTFQ